MEYSNETFKNLEVYQNRQLIYYQHGKSQKEENQTIQDLITQFNFNLHQTTNDNQIIDRFSQMNLQDN
ncbi:unnamed protein product [Paramecium sonneborni]|uniref:Uncharacterized protein n=1 Tax=Paramecium sonneborni TaxID=65129 RepID=A0A8S1P1K7_9CILI|nr:unnamed protein product [Paramecium sonneborni]